MAFSFTPGQIAPQGSQTQTGIGGINPGSAISQAVGPPSDSPFLFIRERGQPFSVMAGAQIVLVVIAGLSVVVCLALFSYSVYLKKSIDDKKAEIELKESSFATYPYEDMKRLSNRMTALDKLLQKYISPRSPLKFLENVVENQVTFDEFKLARDRNDAYSVTFTVVTSNYKTLVQQLDALKLTEYHKVISDTKLNGLADGGNIVKIVVTTPVFVQGKLPDEVIFLPDEIKTADGASTLLLPKASTSPMVKTETKP